MSVCLQAPAKNSLRNCEPGAGRNHETHTWRQRVRDPCAGAGENSSSTQTTSAAATKGNVGGMVALDARRRGKNLERLC